MNTLFVVRFIRRDGEADEEYVYNTYGEAREHYNLFMVDDSELYDRIELKEYYSSKKLCDDLEFER